MNITQVLAFFDGLIQTPVENYKPISSYVITKFNNYIDSHFNDRDQMWKDEQKRQLASILEKFDYAGYKNALDFFWWMRDHQVEFDIAGISYYPKWHGRSMDSLFSVLGDIQFYLRKQPIIAETSYPFTLGWNDYTNNIIGGDGDLLSGYPATPQGQYSFMKELVNRSRKLPFSSGVCYWESNLVAYKGPVSTEGSPWENQAWFDFSNKALPVNWIFKNP